MRRNFNIEISIDYGWEIDIIDFIPPYRAYQPVRNAPASIGICVKEKRKLVAMYDPFCPRTEAIKEAYNINLFREKCIFRDDYNDYEFEGTFIDALTYIQNKYKEYKLPTLEEIAKKKEDLINQSN